MKKITVHDLDAAGMKREVPDYYNRFRGILERGELVALLDDDQKFSKWSVRTDDGHYYTGDIISGLFKFQRWMFTPARWYQFWMPSSGIGGATFASLLIIIICYFISLLIESL